uniref:Uncharacterized protein n=1 Tax=Oryza barthii TaxID=65489 RepID=A0A0D3HTY7_9ORYZ
MAELVLELAGGERWKISACNLKRKCRGVQGKAPGYSPNCQEEMSSLVVSNGWWNIVVLFLGKTATARFTPRTAMNIDGVGDDAVTVALGARSRALLGTTAFPSIHYMKKGEIRGNGINILRRLQNVTGEETTIAHRRMRPSSSSWPMMKMRKKGAAGVRSLNVVGSGMESEMGATELGLGKRKPLATRRRRPESCLHRSLILSSLVFSCLI